MDKFEAERLRVRVSAKQWKEDEEAGARQALSLEISGFLDTSRLGWRLGNQNYPCPC